MNLRSQLTDPYLRAMFAFLTDDADSFDPVLVRIYELSQKLKFFMFSMCKVCIPLTVYYILLYYKVSSAESPSPIVIV